jgi:hypothetical protein
MEHIKLIAIKQQLQSRMHYPEQPAPNGEYLCLDEAFEELLDGFSKWLERHRLGTYVTVYYARKYGYFSQKFADMFTHYCINGWTGA